MVLVLFTVLFAGVCFRCVSLLSSFPLILPGRDSDNELKNDCNNTIRQQVAWIRSPGFPVKYPRFSRCEYIVERYSPDTCELKMSYEWFEVAKMSFTNCTEDYFEIQNGAKHYKVCGELPSGSKKFVFFPKDSNQLIFRFRSSFHQRKGFAIQVKQLPFSCGKEANETVIASLRAPQPCIQMVNGRIGRLTFPDYTEDNVLIDKCSYKIRRSEARACLVQLDFFDFELTYSSGCYKDYLLLPDGQRLCGILGGSRRFLQFPPGQDEVTVEFSSNGNLADTFDIQVSQFPGNCEYGISTNITTGTFESNSEEFVTDKNNGFL